MIKIRQLYSETQNNSRNNFDRVTLERCKKILAYVNRQLENTTAKTDYTNIDELMFYQDKYQQVIDKFNMAINDKTKKPKLQADIVNIFSQIFGQPPPPANTSQPQLANKKQEKIENKSKIQKIQIPLQRPIQIEQSLIKSNTVDPRDLIQIFFDKKKTQIQKSKIGFKSILDNAPKISQKYAVKSNIQAKKDNDENITLLNKQISELSKKLEQTKQDYEAKHGLQNAQKKQFQAKLKTLLQQIERLNHQNERLRHQAQIMVKSQPSPSPQYIPPVEPLPIIQHVYIKQKVKEPEVYDPWGIKYRSNNINQLNKKFQGQSPQQITQYVQSMPLISSAVKVPQKIQFKTNEESIIHKVFPEPILSGPLRFETQFEKSNIRLNRSQIQNQQKNLAIRSKLSFFKPSMVLYRCDEFQLAVKSVDIFPLQSRRITIYINNKDKFTKKLDVNYTCDPTYYQLKTLKKLTQVQGQKQGKQQIQVTLKNKMDLDYLIQAKLTINNKTIKFILPTMMIQFLTTRPQNFIKPTYEKNTITPMFQFSNIFSAIQILPLQKHFQDKVDMGTIYARSKYAEGYIYLRWKSKNQLQVETIKPWSLFLSYLLYKEY